MGEMYVVNLYVCEVDFVVWLLWLSELGFVVCWFGMMCFVLCVVLEWVDVLFDIWFFIGYDDVFV